jgi:predicted secreted protein with PEFG-CTERM motif
MKCYFVLSIVIAALFFTTMTVFAQSQLIYVETSENAYDEGETIVVSGNVTSVIEGAPISLTMFHEGTLVDIAQVDVAKDGKYTTTFKAEGPLWKKDGTYIIRALYGTTTIETSFEFFSKQTLVDTKDIFEVDAGSYGTFDVDYTVRGATVKDMRVDSVALALLVILETEDDGSITLKLPRESIDAKIMNGLDDTFIILIDGVEVPYKEIITNSESRTITIEFEEGDSDIEIIGTFVVPEFGNIVMIILVVGIISTILLSTKFRLPITKSY